MAANIFLKPSSRNLRKEIMIVDGYSHKLVSKKESKDTASKRSLLRRVAHVTLEYHIVVFFYVQTHKQLLHKFKGLEKVLLVLLW